MRKKERKLQRLQGYDYSKNNYYFVTICTHNRENYFGEIIDGEMILNEIGNIIKDRWLWLEEQYKYVFLDEFVIMPNHFHGILIIDFYQNIEESIIYNDTSYSVGNSRDCSLPIESDIKIETVKSLSGLIGAFKTTSSKLINKLENNIFHQFGKFQWHKSFHDRIIRNNIELDNVRSYIKNNPLKWHLDIENPLNRLNENLL